MLVSLNWNGQGQSNFDETLDLIVDTVKGLTEEQKWNIVFCERSDILRHRFGYTIAVCDIELFEALKPYCTVKDDTKTIQATIIFAAILFVGLLIYKLFT